MIFDKTQSAFPSGKHKEIWRRGVLILPEELALSPKVKALMDDELFESCKQMRLFLLHSLNCMYKNAEANEFEPQEYLTYWFNKADTRFDGAAGTAIKTDEVLADRTVIRKKFFNPESPYASIFAETGVQFEIGSDTVEITNTLYPKMFHAMREMAKYVCTKKEKVGEENSFYYCDFRKICPGYKYDKSEKRVFMREIEDRIPLILTDSAIAAAQEFAAYLREKKIKLKWTGLQHNYSETGQTHVGKGICYIGLGDMHLRGKKDGWLISVTLENLDKYAEAIIDEGLQDFIWDNIYFCDKTPADACNGGEKSIYACHRGIDLTVLGKELKYVCRLRNKTVCVYVYDPDETAISRVKRLIELELSERPHP